MLQRSPARQTWCSNIKLNHRLLADEALRDVPDTLSPRYTEIPWMLAQAMISSNRDSGDCDVSAPTKPRHFIAKRIWSFTWAPGCWSNTEWTVSASQPLRLATASLFTSSPIVVGFASDD
jgi:hypothetical protein